jgi:hypothetical protein
MKSKPRLVLDQKAERILRAVYFYRFMGALDVCALLCALLYSPGGLARVRKTLLALSGGGDFVSREYLYRFQLPGEGNPERVYTLGSRGRDFLVNEVGLPVDWYFRPETVKHFSHAHVVHSLLLTRVLVAAERWARSQEGIRLAARRISYELWASPPVVEIEGEVGKKLVKVVPDAWLLFERSDRRRTSVLVEIDRGREYQAAFKAHVAARIEFIASGEYTKIFGTRGVTIAYGTTGERPEYVERRLSSMRQWTREVLASQGRENWAELLRFCSLSLDTVYELPLFDAPVWRRIGSETPVTLFGSAG